MVSQTKNHIIREYADSILFDLSIIGNLILSPTGTILLANKTAIRLFIENEQLVGKTLKELFFTEPDFDVATLLYTILTEDNIEEQYIGQLGFSKETTFWATLNISLLNTPHDNEPYIFCQIQNVSDLKKATDEINNRNHLINELINSIPDNIFVKDTESRFLLANLYLTNNIGAKTPQDLLGKTDFDFFPKKLAGKYRMDELEVIRTRKAKIDIVEQVIDKQNNIRWYSTSKLPLYDNNGLIIGIMGIGREITRLVKEKKALKKAMHTAEKANKLKTAFLSNLSHEIRTPLNGILGFSQFLKDVGPDNPKSSKYLDYIISNGNRLLNLIVDIIDISKIDAGEISLQHMGFNVNDLINKLKGYTETGLATENKLNIGLKLEVDDINKPFIFYTDKQRLEQILRIVLSNAIKFTDAGSISLGYHIFEDTIQFMVRDTGIGIDRKHHKQIFDRFNQVDNSTTRKYEGVGLGLSIAKELIKLLNGEIELRSKLNKGSDFFIRLPIIKIPATN